MKTHFEEIQFYFPTYATSEAGKKEFERMQESSESGIDVIGRLALSDDPLLVEGKVCSCWLEGFKEARGDIWKLSRKMQDSLREMLEGDAHNILSDFNELYVKTGRLDSRLAVDITCEGEFSFFDYTLKGPHPFRVLEGLKIVPDFVFRERYSKLKELAKEVHQDTPSSIPYVKGMTLEEALGKARDIYSEDKDIREIADFFEDIIR